MLVRPVFIAGTDGTLMRNFTRRQDTQHGWSHQLHDHIAISAAKDHHTIPSFSIHISNSDDVFAAFASSRCIPHVTRPIAAVHRLFDRYLAPHVAMST